MKPWIDGAAIDKEVAEETPCEECGAKMTYRAEYTNDSGSYDEPQIGRTVYRAFAVCTNPECGNEVGF